MGRRTPSSIAKSKEKRAQRKEDRHKISLAMAAIEKANKQADPFEPFKGVFQMFQKNGVSARLFVKKALDLDESIRQWAFNLTKKNMQLKYEQCSWGWSDEKKLQELSDENAWYLVAQSFEGPYIGFSHFRFDIDEGIEVLYCYELQLEPQVQRKGLGKFMMQILELMAFKNNMRKVILTVLKNNQYSKFFKSINYELDESSPTDDEDESYPYEILSKRNRRLAPESRSYHRRSHHHHDSHSCSGHHHHHHHH